MSNLLIAALGVALSTNAPQTNAPASVAAVLASAATNQNELLAERELAELMSKDDDAAADVDRWIKENQEFTAKGAGMSAEAMDRRIRERFEPVGKGYQDFLSRYTNHVRGHIAYGSFLNDLGDEDGAKAQWEKALALDPKNPAVYDNLAGIYGHTGSIEKSFEYYEKAISLNPDEPLYYHNLGTAVFLFRKDAIDYYHITEQKVFDKALELYSHAMKLAPKDFPLASDVAQTYYGIQPFRADDALRSWTNALQLAHDEIEREGVYVHLARVNMLAGRYAQARSHLSGITNEMYAELKRRISRSLDEKEKAAAPETTAEKTPSK